MIAVEFQCILGLIVGQLLAITKKYVPGQN